MLLISRKEGSMTSPIKMSSHDKTVAAYSHEANKKVEGRDFSITRPSYQVVLSLPIIIIIILPNKFINARAYKLLELSHDVHVARDEQITPQYSLRRACLTTCMKSTRIKESEALCAQSTQVCVGALQRLNYFLHF